MSNSKIDPIPQHLKVFSWYAEHQAWLKEHNYAQRHDPDGATSRKADLSNADLSKADLSNECK